MGNRVRIDVEQVVSQVSPMIYGQFLEQIGRAVYGGIYEPGNPLSDKDGFRIDVLEKIKELQTPIMRWPGGNFVSAYHWMDGVGPKSKRPRRLELAWEAVESNQFGTHEFMELCRRLNTEPYMAVNLGWGTPEEAVNWAEYCNAKTDTSYANLRRENGAAEPFGVKYWGLGNEIYGTWQHGHCEPEEYAHKASETAKMIRKMDSSTKFVFCGGNNNWWDFKVLEYLFRKRYAPLVDYISLHRYDQDNTWYGLLARTADFERDVRGLKSMIEMLGKEYGQTHLPMISVDEWNVWYRRFAERPVMEKYKQYYRAGEDIFEELYNLRDALYFGCVLNMFIRHGDRVKMANVAQTVNVIAPIIATPKGSYYQPTFFPLKYYRQMHQALGLDVNVESETISLTAMLEKEEKNRYLNECPPHWEGKAPAWPGHWVNQSLPLVDTAATRSADGKTVTISLVNRDRDNVQAVEIDLFDYQPRTGRQVTISGPDPMGYMLRPNGPGLEDLEYDTQACVVTDRILEKTAGKFTIELPGHAIMILELHA